MKLFEANQKRDEGELKRSQNKKFAVCSWFYESDVAIGYQMLIPFNSSDYIKKQSLEIFKIISKERNYFESWKQNQVLNEYARHTAI
jgi:hypothetical protein